MKLSGFLRFVVEKKNDNFEIIIYNCMKIIEQLKIIYFLKKSALQKPALFKNINFYRKSRPNSILFAKEILK